MHRWFVNTRLIHQLLGLFKARGHLLDEVIRVIWVFLLLFLLDLLR